MRRQLCNLLHFWLDYILTLTYYYTEFTYLYTYRAVNKFAILAQKETRWVMVQMGGAQIGAASQWT